MDNSSSVECSYRSLLISSKGMPQGFYTNVLHRVSQRFFLDFRLRTSIKNLSHALIYLASFLSKSLLSSFFPYLTAVFLLVETMEFLTLPSGQTRPHIARSFKSCVCFVEKAYIPWEEWF